MIRTEHRGSIWQMFSTLSQSIRRNSAAVIPIFEDTTAQHFGILIDEDYALGDAEYPLRTYYSRHYYAQEL